MALVAAGACASKADNADTTRPADSSAAAATSPATVPASVDSGAAGRPAAPPPRPAPGSDNKAPPPPPPASKAPTGADTARGIVAVVGTDRDKHVIVRPAGESSISLAGPMAALVGRASGAEVWVSGTRVDRTLTVVSFAVRTVDGIAAVDGELVVDGDRLVIVTADGKRHTIANPPPALRQHVGGRVWVSGNLAQGPVAFGIIQDKP